MLVKEQLLHLLLRKQAAINSCLITIVGLNCQIIQAKKNDLLQNTIKL